MSLFDKYSKAVDDLTAHETMLKELDFSAYTIDAFDFEKSELQKIWEKYKKLYNECSVETVEKKKELVLVQSKYSIQNIIYIPFYFQISFS